jgi:hypothetical protein
LEPRDVFAVGGLSLSVAGLGLQVSVATDLSPTNLVGDAVPALSVGILGLVQVAASTNGGTTADPIAVNLNVQADTGASTPPATNGLIPTQVQATVGINPGTTSNPITTPAVSVTTTTPAGSVAEPVGVPAVVATNAVTPATTGTATLVPVPGFLNPTLPVPTPNLAFTIQEPVIPSQGAAANSLTVLNDPTVGITSAAELEALPVTPVSTNQEVLSQLFQLQRQELTGESGAASSAPTDVTSDTTPLAVDALGQALDRFLADGQSTVATFVNWLAQLGPLPWILMGLAVSLTLAELARLRRRQRDQVFRTLWH